MQEQADLLIRGGIVIDPASATTQLVDVAVRDGRILRVAGAAGMVAADRVIDARDAYVTPGFIDMHTHLYRGATAWGIDPEPIAAQTGVTTWVDAGSAGAYTWPGLSDRLRALEDVRSYALLNISSIGLPALDGELSFLPWVDEALAIDTIRGELDLLRGVKVRMSSPTVGNHGLAPLISALRVARSCEVPLMMHIGNGPPYVADALDLLQAGDVVTHSYNALSMSLVAHGEPIAAAVRARERGVLFDLGHGSGSFSFAVAEQLISTGWLPDTISSDLHQFSRAGPVVDLPTCMTKLLDLGMSVEQTIRAVTTAPARALSLPEIGTLNVGAVADLAVIELREGGPEIIDSHLVARQPRRTLSVRETILNGRLLRPAAEAAPPRWAPGASSWRAHHAELMAKVGAGLTSKE